MWSTLRFIRLTAKLSLQIIFIKHICFNLNIHTVLSIISRHYIKLKHIAQNISNQNFNIFRFAQEKCLCVGFYEPHDQLQIVTGMGTN